jgi:tetratricopeptide (TPR) repeat protein
MKNIQLKLYFILCILTICSGLSTTAQTAFEADTSKINYYNKESERLQEKNADSALYFSTNALKLARTISFEEGALTAINNTGWIYYRKGDYQTAIKYAFDAITLAEKLKNFNELAKGYNTIGSVYNDQDIISNSIDFFRQSLFAYKKANNQIGIGRALNNLAYTYFKSKQLDSALYISRQAYAQNKTLQDKYFFAFTLRTMGDIYKAKGNVPAASAHFFEALDYARQSQKHFLTLAF